MSQVTQQHDVLPETLQRLGLRPGAVQAGAAHATARPGQQGWYVSGSAPAAGQTLVLKTMCTGAASSSPTVVYTGPAQPSSPAGAQGFTHVGIDPDIGGAVAVLRGSVLPAGPLDFAALSVDVLDAPAVVVDNTARKFRYYLSDNLHWPLASSDAGSVQASGCSRHRSHSRRPCAQRSRGPCAGHPGAPQLHRQLSRRLEHVRL